ncbi:MAG: cellulose binding domain-containing protein [Balneolaceae bacterium]|nr:cellulose binding domain-containing protein [Balneolaceae bacterium]
MRSLTLLRTLVPLLALLFGVSVGSVYAQPEDITLQYKNNNANNPTQSPQPHMRLINNGSSTLNLSDLTIRYWFTSEPSGQDVYALYSAAVGNGEVNGTFGTVNGQRYLEISFTSNAEIPGYLGGNGNPNDFPAGASTGNIQNSFHDDGWNNYDQSDDFSFDPNETSYPGNTTTANNTNITVYYQGSLVSGSGPPGTAQAEEMSITQQPTGGTAGQIFSPPPTVLLEDANGNPVEGVEVTVTLNQGSFAGGSTTILTTDASGEATFDDLSINTANTGYELTFDAAADLVSDEVSNSFSISAAAADQISISQQPPASTAAGQTLSSAPAVTITDAFGNPVSGSDITITLNKNSFASGTLTRSTNSSGVAAFNDLVITTKATGYKITFDPAAGGLSDRITGNFAITEAAASQMSVTTQPGESVTNGTVEGPPTVRVTDTYGNGISGVNVTVSETGGYTFDAGTLTRATGSNGFAAFDDLEIHTADTGYQLTFDASAGGVSNVNSNTFDVVSSGGSMTVNASPGQSIAGVTLSPSPQVTLEDDQGNPLSGVDITVTLNQNSFASGTLTRTTNGSGVATFNDLVVTAAESGYQITFDADQTGVANAYTSSFEVVAASASSMSMETQPVNTSSGSILGGPPAVTLVDTYGNPVSGVDITVTLNQNSFASGTTVVATDAGGEAEFNDLVISTADTGYELTFDADASGVSNVISNNFNVTAGSASNMSISQQPTQSTAGVTLSPAPAVTLTDGQGNPVQGVSVTVSLNKNSFSGGSTTVVNTNSSGVATFGNLKIGTAASAYQLTFSASGVSNAVSNTFNVVQPNPAFGSITVEYKNDNTSSTSQQLEPWMRLNNESNVDINLSDLTVRYWFTSEPPGQDVHVVDFAEMTNDDSNITGTFGTIDGNHFLEVGFDSDIVVPIGLGGDGSTPDLFPVNANTGAIQQRIHDDGFANYDQTNDYSYDATKTSYTEHDKITIYYKGSLVWGTPPSGAAEAEEMTITQQPTGTTAGQSLSPSPTVLLEDAQGNPVEGVDVTVTVNQNSFSGGSTTVVTSNASGEAVFDNLSFQNAASGYELTFNADANLVDNKTSNSFTISAAAASQMSITQQPPSSATAGATLNPAPKVTLTDAYGNVKSGENVTVSLNKNSFSSGTLTRTTNSSGVITFSGLVITAAASGYKIVFDAAASGVANKESNTFTVNPAAASTATITTQPGESVTTGSVEGPPAVKITDTYGNPISGVNVTVSETGGYTFDAGTLTRATGSNGIATFNDLEIHSAASGYQLTFEPAPGSVSSLNSNTFTVVEPAGSMTIDAEPGQTTAGQTLSPAPSVTLVDGQDNPLQGVNITVSVNQNSFASGTVTVQTNSSGVATFSDLVIEAAASGYQITFDADETGVPNVVTSSFEVVAANATALNITTQPANTETGNTLEGPPAVVLTDNFGNPVQGTNITVSLNKNSFDSGTTTLATDGSGEAVFDDLVISTIATGYELSFDPDAQYVSNALSDDFDVTAGAADDLEITTQPSESTSDVTISPAPVVLVTDGGGNPVSGINVSVSLNKSNFTGGSTTVATSDASGEAVFNNLSISTADTGYELSFSTTGLTSVTSDAFEVVQPNPPFGSIRLQYRNNATNTTSETIQPWIKIFNDSNLDINLSDLTVRYWFTSEPAGSDEYVVDFAEMTNDESNFSGSFNTEEGRYFLEVGFDSDIVVPIGLGGDGSTPNLFPASASTGGIQQRIHDDNFQNYDQSDDYSFNPTITNYSDFDSINVYYKGQLIWGDAPPMTETYYSRQTGSWGNATNWSTVSHTGAVATVPPGPEDEVIIGSGHKITLTDNITNDNSVTVSGTGKLYTGNWVLDGTGDFVLEPDGTLQVGSVNGINANISSGSIQSDGTRSYSASADYIFQAGSPQTTGDGLPATLQGDLTIDNSTGVTADKSYEVNGTLFLNSGPFIFEDGDELLANDKTVSSGELTFRLEVDSPRGYRLLSSPIDTDFDNFLDGVHTQGFTGATYGTSYQPNVLWYDETYEGTDNQRWRAPSNITDDVGTGRGYHVYMFGDIPSDSDYNDPFPYTLEVNGQEHEGPVDLNVTFTAAADSGWNLVGNPYGATLDWEDASWTKTNIDPNIYVWDPATNQYKTWNGAAGDITDGLIAPFQGFWVKANDTNPQLVASENAKTTGGEFIGSDPAAGAERPEVPSISLRAYHSKNLQSTVHFSFTEDGTTELDRMDAYKLLPPPNVTDYVEAYSRAENRERLAISNLPRWFGKVIEVPIEVNAYRDGQPLADELWLKVDKVRNLPNHWEAELVHQASGKRIAVNNLRDSIRVSLEHLAGQQALAAPATGGTITTNDERNHVRFTLRIQSIQVTSDSPQQYEVGNNYPNPFSESTNLRFGTPREGRVRLHVYTVMGRKVETLVDEVLPAGYHEVPWRPRGLSSGVYLIVLESEHGAASGKVTYIKQ